MADPLDDIMTAAPVIPVLAIDSPERAVPLARALVAGGLPVLEVTLRTADALLCIAAIARDVPEAVVGAGTVLTAEDLMAVGEAGARFAVSPGLTDALAQAARAAPVPLLPGVATASEIMGARAAGFERLKFFPAEAAGGIAALKSFAGPFPSVRFCPTGGVGARNLRAYLALPNVLCAGGSWVAPNAAVQQGDWAGIERLAAAACRTAAN